MKTKLFLTGLAFLAVTTMLSAQDNKVSQSQQKVPATGKAFVDADKNGICDNFEKGAQTGTSCPGNANLRGRGMGQGNCQGANGCGQGKGRGQGLRSGKNFVDADKNGVCDYYETSSKK